VQMLATIGYEGASLDAFIATLHMASIRNLIDVRELPLSRRRGFSKGALSKALADEGIEYIHLRGLGDPKEGRLAARANDHAAFVRIFRRHLDTEVARTDLAKAITFARAGDACLMCYERDPNNCHRKLVAEQIASIIPIEVHHLGVNDALIEYRREIDRAGRRPRQSASARR